MNLYKLLLVLTLTLMIGCNGSDSAEEIIDGIEDPEDILDLIDEPKRKPIDVSKMGINVFGNNPEFGSACEQFNAVKSNLKIKYFRLLFQWNDAVQPTSNSPINFNFYDELASCIPNGVEVIVVMAGLPSWLNDRSTWINDNPRITFVERWVKPVLNRYGNNSAITAWQIWNEPNMIENPDNTTLDVANSPENYVEMLAAAYSFIKDQFPNKLVVNAATTGIAQNFPDTLRYNRRMKDAGAVQFVDIWAVHYYGKQFEKFIGGVKEFLNDIPRPIWVTESGQQGADKQLAYVETTWPYLMENVPAIERIYYYQYSASEPAPQAFALITNTPSQPVSDLYNYLINR